MLFNSLEYVLFLLAALAVYAITPFRFARLRILWLLIFSYVFYGWWNWRYVFLLLINSFSAYFLADAIYHSSSANKRRFFLILTLVINLGLLFYFKYYNFFIDGIIKASGALGMPMHFNTLSIILPIGISFYTFQTISYVADVFNKKILPAKNAVSFFTFVSFFPHLIAGPIQRASSLLVQLENPKRLTIENIKNGGSQILWGLFKKVAVADTCGVIADHYFNSYQNASGGNLALASIFFTIQLYSDFSGYSDIATGSAKLFGINLIQNFKYPFFAKSMTEFWRKWHVSLYNWFRDYVYIPLGGSSRSMGRTLFNIFIVFILSGIWHGANLTFIAWGLLNFVFIAAELILKHLKGSKTDNNIPSDNSFINSLKMLRTFLIFSFTLVLFRSQSIDQALVIYQKIFSMDIVSFAHNNLQEIYRISGFVIALLVGYEWFFKDRTYALNLSGMPQWFSWVSHSVIVFILIAILMLNITDGKNFIYFQF